VQLRDCQPELVTTDASDQIFSADAALQAFCDLLEERITNCVAPLLIDEGEVVKIEDNQGRFLATLLCYCYYGL
jgi:hypothetical protein